MSYLWFKRKPGQKILIEGGITILIDETHRGHIRVGVDAPRSLWVDREEVRASKLATAAPLSPGAEMATLAGVATPPPTTGGK